MNVIDDSIVVIVNTVACYFKRINPELVLKIYVLKINSSVHNGDNCHGGRNSLAWL